MRGGPEGEGWKVAFDIPRENRSGVMCESESFLKVSEKGSHVGCSLQ